MNSNKKPTIQDEIDSMNNEIDRVLKGTQINTDELIRCPETTKKTNVKELESLLKNEYYRRVEIRNKLKRISPEVKEMSPEQMFFVCDNFDYLKKYFESIFMYTRKDESKMEACVVLNNWSIYSREMYDYFVENEIEFFEDLEVMVFKMGGEEDDLL